MRHIVGSLLSSIGQLQETEAPTDYPPESVVQLGYSYNFDTMTGTLGVGVVEAAGEGKFNRFASALIAWLRTHLNLVSLAEDQMNIIVANREQDVPPPCILVSIQTIPRDLEMDRRFESYCQCLCSHADRVTAEQMASTIYDYASYSKTTGLDAAFSSAYVATDSIRPVRVQEIELENDSSDTFTYEAMLVVSWRELT